MMLLTTVRSLLVAVLAAASWASPQVPSTGETAPGQASPDPKTLLQSCLDAHRGSRRGLPGNLLFIGDVQQRSAKADVNEADIWQWYVRTDNGTKVTEQMVTRMRAKGTSRYSIRGFDGRRHFVVTDNRRVTVDGKASYKVDLANIKRDLGLTRFLVNHFLAGSVLRSDAKFAYLGREKIDKRESHRISRTTPDGVTTIYFVNAEAGKKPFLNGIEFPAAKDQPRRIHVFSSVKAFGAFHVPQEIKITDQGDAKSVVSIWITQFRTDVKRTPEWAEISRYPRKLTPRTQRTRGE